MTEADQQAYRHLSWARVARQNLSGMPVVPGINPYDVAEVLAKIDGWIAALGAVVQKAFDANDARDDAKAGDPPDGSRAVEMSYVNYRGEIRQRFVTPLGPIYWGSNEWHTDEQWLFDVFDHQLGQVRTFALRGVLGVMRTTAVVNGQVQAD